MIEDLLIERGRAWRDGLGADPPIPDVTSELRGGRPRPGRRAVWLAVAAVVVVASAALAVTVGLIRRDPTPPAAPTLVTTRLSDVVITHPRAWRLVKPRQALSFGLVQNLGQLTNEPTRNRCVRTANSSTCRSSVERLRPGGVLVSVAATYLVRLTRDRLALNATVSGRPAHIGPERLGGCVPGATRALALTVYLVQHRDAAAARRVDVCLATPSPDQLAAAHALLRSVRLDLHR